MPTKKPEARMTTKDIVHNGRRIGFRVVEEPQADLYQCYIGGLLTYFTKAELEAGIERSKKLMKKYGWEER